MISHNAIHAVLNCVRLEGGLADAEDLVTLALAIRQNQFPASGLHLAISECITQGWIKVLTRQDCLADADRWKNQPHQNMEPYREGAIDFTQAGWELHVRQCEARSSGGIGRLMTSLIPHVHYLWDTPGRLSLITASQNTFVEAVAKIQSGEDDPIRTHLDEDYQIVNVTGPYSIGPWWINRFYQTSEGFRADAFYRQSTENR